MGTITIRRLDDTVIEAIKRRAAQAGRSMEEEARRSLQEAYTGDQLQRQREFAARQLARLRNGELPRSTVDSVEIIRQMREERDEQLFAATRSRGGADR